MDRTLLLAARSCRFSSWFSRAARRQLARPGPPEAPAAWPLAAWKPIPENPVFAGTGRDTWDRKIRERGYILVGDDGIYHLWYTGYAVDRPPTMSLGHGHFARRHSLDPRSREPDLHRIVGRGRLRRSHDGAYFMFAEGKNDIAHLLTSSDGRKWTDQGSLDIRKTDGIADQPGPLRHATAWFENGTWYLFYERGDQGVWLATSKDRKVWTNVAGRPGHRHGPRAVRPGRRRREPDRQARRRLLRLLSRQLPAALEGLDDLPGPLARPGPLGEISRQPDHQQ